MNHENLDNTLHSTDPKHSALNTLSTVIFYTSLFVFIVALAFPHNPAGNWYQQFMPNIGGRSIADVFFLDSLTGWAVTNATNQNPDTIFVLKTVNSGNNWNILYGKVQTGGGFPGYTRIYFLNQNTGFASTVTGFEKTTNGGTNWFPLYTGETFQDISVLNNDTIWLASGNPLTGGVFFTSNGGASWQNQLFLGNQNPNHVYFYNARLGFVGKDNQYLRRTSNGGGNWSEISGAGGFLDMYFTDSLTGWKTSFQKTTDGGFTWVNQVLPSGGDIILSHINQFTNIGSDTIWGVGGTVFWPGYGNRGMIYRTTNSGVNWLFQVADTNINIGRYLYTTFSGKFNGWAYTTIPTGIHTTTGGDPIWFTPVTQISSEVPKEYILFNNYPNPFNPVTTIKYTLTSNVKIQTSNVKLIVYDIQGRETAVLVNDRQNAGTYQTTFDGSNYSSGIYFYSLIIDGKIIDTRKMMLIK